MKMEVLMMILQLAIGLMMMGAFALGIALAFLALCIMFGHRAEEVEHEGKRLFRKNKKH